MNRQPYTKFIAWIVPGLLLCFSPAALSQSACVEIGGMAYDNWTKTNSGGTGELPDGALDSDYVRCKACHGWDHMATDGGYVRRSRNEGRSNAGAGDGDMTSRNISMAAREGAMVTADMIWHQDTGRAYEDGMGSWVDLDDDHSAANKAAHTAGFTLGNQHPDFSTGGMTQEQADCLAEFLNSADADPSVYFDAIYPHLNPVLYDIVDTADAEAGETYYADNCMGCHGDPASEGNGSPEGGILAYLAQDGKFSEFSHKVRWGIPDTIMSRGSMGSPSAADVADLMLYLQDLGGTGFYLTEGVNGTWLNNDRDGEGFNVEIVDDLAGGKRMVVFFYTFDDMGNQVYLIGVGPVVGDMAELSIVITDSGLWGDNFDPDLVERTAWGTGVFVGSSCDALHMAVVPNAEMVGMGFSELEYDLERVATPLTMCP